MKSIEEQIGGKCVHFNGMQNESCKCGINYKQSFGERPVLKMPCIKDRMSHLTDEIIPCDKLEFPTQEEVERQIDSQTKGLKLTLSALSSVKQYIKKTGEKKATIKCPNGEHDLSYVQAESNGHIWMACKTCDIRMMQ